MTIKIIGAEEVVAVPNGELERKGCLVVKGKVRADYFEERYFGRENGNVD